MRVHGLCHSNHSYHHISLNAMQHGMLACLCHVWKSLRVPECDNLWCCFVPCLSYFQDTVIFLEPVQLIPAAALRNCLCYEESILSELSTPCILNLAAKTKEFWCSYYLKTYLKSLSSGSDSCSKCSYSCRSYR